MKVFAAQNGSITVTGSLSSCMQWCNDQCQKTPSIVVKLLRIRPREDAVIIAEITADGWRFISNGRAVKLHLKKAIRC